MATYRDLLSLSEGMKVRVTEVLSIASSALPGSVMTVVANRLESGEQFITLVTATSFDVGPVGTSLDEQAPIEPLHE